MPRTVTVTTQEEYEAEINTALAAGESLQHDTMVDPRTGARELVFESQAIRDAEEQQRKADTSLLRNSPLSTFATLGDLAEALEQIL